MRIGFGYDIHRFKKGRKLYLGGVRIKHSLGLDGHSDADVLLHAICDALLGAAGLNDIGHYFPNTDAEYKNISSIKLLEKVCLLLRKNRLYVVNIDSTIIAEQPKMQPHIKQMKQNIAKVLKIKDNAVGIKATTNEKIGELGRGKGIAALAVVLIEKRNRNS